MIDTPPVLPWNARKRSDFWLASAVLVGLLLATADMSAMSTLLPLIAGSFDASRSAPWLISLFMTAMALSGMAAGALSDSYGEREVQSAALVLFVAAAVVAALSRDMPILMVARALQGIGAGAIIVLSYSSLAALFGAERHALVQTLISLTWGAAALCAPIIGLAIARRHGFRAVFLLDAALGALCIVGLWRKRGGRSKPPREALDALAQGAFAVFVAALLVALSLLGGRAPSTKIALAVAVCTSAAIALGVRARRRPTACPVPLEFLRDPRLGVLTVIVPCASGAMYASVTFVPLAFGMHATNGTLTLPVMSAALGFVLASSVCGWLLRHFGFRALTVFGALSMAWGAWGLTRELSTENTWQLMRAEVAIGVGLGCVAVASVVFAQYAAPAGYLARYTSAIQVLRNIGAALGIGIFPLLAVGKPANTSSPASLHGFVAVSALLLACALLACVLPRHPPLPKTNELKSDVETTEHVALHNENRT